MKLRSLPLEQDWFTVESPEAGIFTIEEPLHAEAVKSYLIVGSERAVLIDTGMGVGDIKALVETLTTRPVTVLNSHGHWDHIGGTHAFQATSEILIHRLGAAALRHGVDNSAMQAFLSSDQLLESLPPNFDLATVAIPGVEPNRLLDGGETLDLGDRLLAIVHALGHAPDLVVAVDRERGLLFSTDAAYAGALYAQLDGSDLVAYAATMRLLSDLVPSLRTVYPSHGASPISPTLIPRMRDALEAAVDGKSSDRVVGGVRETDYDGFSLLISASAAAKEGRC